MKFEEVTELTADAWAAVAEFNLIDSTGGVIDRAKWKATADSTAANAAPEKRDRWRSEVALAYALGRAGPAADATALARDRPRATSENQRIPPTCLARTARSTDASPSTGSSSATTA